MSTSNAHCYVEDWCAELICTRSLEYKLDPPGPPLRWRELSVRAPLGPGRPPQLRQSQQRFKTPSVAQLQSTRRRAQLLHTFFHHELQAAELMAWAILRFPDRPLAFRRGLLKLIADELRHARLYAAQVQRLGFEIGDFEVRDWFWERIPNCRSALEFVALMSLGFEAANLEHCVHFERLLRQAGDPEAAQIQRQIELDEVGHVAFGRHWFEQWHGELEFDAWRAQLPRPVTPLLLRRTPLNRSARLAAGLSDTFIERLFRWSPEPGS